MTLSVDELKDVLAYYQALGFERLPVKVVAKDALKSIQIPEGDSPYGSTGALTGRQAELDALRGMIGNCQRCKLARHRKNIVFGAGSPEARLMFIGEAPGREEDLQGLPFVGDAGLLLTKLIVKMGMKREDVYIANIIKCRPPLNRDPEEDEVSSCRGFIEKQIDIIRPQVIMTLGRIAVQVLMDAPKLKITSARGHFLSFKGIPVMPTFHPAYLLRNPGDKILTWSDAQKVLARLDLSHA